MNLQQDAENEGTQTVKNASKRVPLGEIAANKRKASEHEAPVSPKRQRYVELDHASTQPHKNIYGEDEEDEITCVPEYVDEIFSLLYAKQVEFMVDEHYMDNQPELKWNVRGVLVNWLERVHLKFRLLDETLYLCINIMDRYLSQVEVPLSELQLVGTTALFIACKYEEVFSPALENFTYVSKTTTQEVVEMEAKILAQLDWNMGYPNPLNFLRRCSKADQSDTENRTIAKYILEISLFDHTLFAFRPSDIAAAALYLGRKIAGPCDSWDSVPELVYYSGGLTSESLRPITQKLVQYMVGPVNHPNFFDKYSKNRYMQASILCRDWSKQMAKHYLTPEQVERIQFDESTDNSNA